MKPLVGPGSQVAVAMSPVPFWSRTPADQAAILGCGLAGLTTAQARARLRRFGLNADQPVRRISVLLSVARRLIEPLSLVLLVAAGISAATGDGASASMITVMILLSVGLDAVQERRAARAADLLKHSVAAKADVRRGDRFHLIPVEKVVPGDLIRVRAGDIIPADALVVEAEALAVNQAALTGEAYPAEKRAGLVEAASGAEAANALFRGSVAVSGEAQALVVATGRNTLFGAAASALNDDEGPSPFQRDLRGLGLLIARATGVLALGVLFVNVLLGRPLLQSLMFAVALAVGLTPELLPMITTVTLSRGAVRMSRRKVIVKRLAAIHDLGAMTVLCTDKTGTLTSGEIVLERSLDAVGREDSRACELAALSAFLAGDRGPLDAALMAAAPHAANGCRALKHLPFDYRRRIGGVWADGKAGRLLVAKGAPEAVLAACASVRRDGQTRPLTPAQRRRIAGLVEGLARQGLCAVAVASRPLVKGTAPDLGQLERMTFEGLCSFADPLKTTAAQAIERLGALGVRVVVLSGDDPVIVGRLGGLLGWKEARTLTGADLAGLSGEALGVQARGVSLFARLTPEQKVRVIHALQAGGEVVGYLGDGVNDAPGLKAADVGLSVEGATGVARGAADMILLAPDLDVVAAGVEEGRRTFANILKYVRMGSSSNFGNMLSMAVASLFLPFLPMLAGQILLNNLFYDLSEVGIPFDRVRPEDIAQPQRWSLRGVARFALVMGPLSSCFDLLTFAVLLLGFHLDAPGFRTAWFLESISTQILVIFLIRTRGQPWRDRPDPWLTGSALGALAAALAVPFTPLGRWFGFEPPSLGLAGVLALIVAAYLLSVGLLRRVAADRRFEPQPTRA